MNIAFICTEKLPSPAVKGGAIQMMIDGIVPYLKEQHDITIFSITDPALPDFEQKEGVTYYRFPRSSYRFSVAEELKNHTFDIIHVCNRPRHIPLYKEASPSSQFILSVHNEMFAENKISDEEGKKTIEQVTAITTVSQFIKDTIIARFPEAEEKTSVVYSGVDLNEFKPVWTKEGQRIRNEMRKKYGISKRSKVILFIGRLSPSKGPHILIEAMKYILPKHEDAVLVIVGGKWFSDNRVNKYVRYLHTLASPYENHVIFTKFVPANEIYHMYVMGDLFVCSSQWNEPLARVHYEAMAAGVPIMTTDRGGNAEVIEDEENGLLIKDYKNPFEYARVINEMLDLPGFGRWLAQNGRKAAEEQFDFKHVASRYQSVYFQAIDALADTTPF
ncbi:MAG TPA: glycosyltransferase family 4 protein [Bacillus sp. (in: firmicutes)]|uniref:glycosyltransferase family 4 protein n=1 Tax=Bacillus litorisediminis TaxID=2922713 RepID=UPI001FACB0AE|nr:glycosyltransferase family 4 protein [Bacillus litorisediminis]HWO77070.1 glycosyltransferase family 4 protein [Bacillus sp. (in: firmicutes)]